LVFPLGALSNPFAICSPRGKRYLGIMLAVADETMGLKLVCFYHGNAGTSVPSHTTMILLFRPETGEPLAIMDGRLITEMRTAGGYSE
jgi:thiomorpholine-carboxylate dehydrogenase